MGARRCARAIRINHSEHKHPSQCPLCSTDAMHPSGPSSEVLAAIIPQNPAEPFAHPSRPSKGNLAHAGEQQDIGAARWSSIVLTISDIALDSAPQRTVMVSHSDSMGTRRSAMSGSAQAGTIRRYRRCARPGSTLARSDAVYCVSRPPSRGWQSLPPSDLPLVAP